MPKRKTFDGRKQREKQKIRMRQKRQQSQYQDTPPIELVVESNVSVERMDGAISAPPSNFLGQVSMGFPHSKKPLARVQASCSERMHSPAPRLPSPRGSRLFVREQDKAPSPDSPAWVCAPPRAPGPDTVHVSGSAGQAQLDTSREEETSSMLKDEETLTRNKTDTERKTKHILNEHKILETIYENQNNDISQDIYDYQNNEKLKNVIENQCIKISENMYDNHNEISRNLYENDVTENINENCVNAIDVILYQNEETRTKKDVSDKIENENDLEASKNDGRGRKRQRNVITLQRNYMQEKLSDNKFAGGKKAIFPRNENFSLVSKKVIQGSFHQGDAMFGENAGTQCVANCLASISYHKMKNVMYWTSEDMDKILITGNELYTFLQRCSSINNRYLLVEELPQLFECFEMSYIFKPDEPLTSVILPSDELNYADFHALPLNEALEISLGDTDGCFVCYGGNSFLIGKFEHGFFLFDSHSRSIDGMVNENGKSTRILLADLGQVYMHLHSLAFSMGYSENVLCNLTGVYCKISGMTDTESEFEPFATTAGTEGESEGNDEELQNDDLMIICSEIKGFTFNPLNEGVKRNLCEELNVPLMCTENVGIAQDVGKELTSPETEKEIIGDGNCFFRAVSFSVSNSEDFYNTIRSAVCAHMMANQELFKTFLRNGQESIESHLSASLMTQEGTWATEVEILAMAHFLRVDIFTYSGGRWLKFSGDMVTKCLNKRRGAIYLHHLHQNHYNVVISMHVDCDSNETVLMRGETRENIMQRRNIGKSSSRLTCYQRRKNIQKEKYKQNPELRSRKLAAAALKYKEHKSYQLSVKEKYREKYRSDTKYRDRSKKLYDKVRDVKKEISKKKYRYNYAHRDDLKRRSSIKYNTDTAHREDLKTRSTEKYRRNSLHREDVKLRSKDKYRTDPLHKVDVKMRSTEKYRTDPLHKEEIKKRSTVKYQTNAKHREEMKKRSIAKYQSDEKHRENVKNRSKQIYKSDEAHRKRVNSASTRRYNTDESYRKRNLRKRSMKYETDEAFRSKAKVYSKEMYASSTCVRLKKKDEVIQQRRAKRQKLENEKEVANLFKCKVKEGIDYICCCCNRLLFENQVQRCNPNTYEKNTEAALAAEVCIQKKYFHQCSEDCLSNCTKSSLWICFTCHRKILRGKIPAEATVNNLFLEDIPKELCDLNCLEKHLIALQIPFMKVMGLPHGGQKNVHGPVVCVPSDMKKVASLPLKEDENLLLRVKLKRKLNYKGYFEYQFVDPKHVFAALDYLKQNNKWYTNVTIDTNWKENDYDEVTDVTDEIKLDDVENQEVATDTCLQPLDIAQEVLDHYFDDIYNIAPGEGKNPVRMLQEPGNEAKSFPYLFPSGKFSWNDERSERITLSRYFNNRLMNADNRFAKDTSYIFFSQYLSELNQVIEKTQISIRKSVTKIGGEKLVTQDMLQDPETLSKLLRNDEALRFMQPIRGTPAYWSAAQKDLFAMLRQLGIPTWFCSFSAAEHRWNDAIRTILQQQNDHRDPDLLDWSEKNEVLKSNPVTVARMFEHRFHLFQRDVILSPSEPIGKVVDFFQRVEFQQRGSPHMHCLYWVENSPKIDQDGEEAVCNFIDKYVTCAVPSEEKDAELRNIVLAVQQHSKKHSKSCRKKGSECRFNFPRPPSLRTFITSPETDEIDQNIEAETKNEAEKSVAKDMLISVWDQMQLDNNYSRTIEDIFNALGLTQEQYETAYNMITKKKAIVLQREPCELWINQYNSCLLRCWDANMDIQFVLDPFSCIVYIISYISKSEREMGMLLKQTKIEAEEGNCEARQTLKKIGSAYLKHREVSAQEAVYRVCNLKMKECSRKVVFVPVGENPTRLSKPLFQIKQKTHKEKEEANEEGNEEDEEDIWMTNIVERYENRPNKTMFHDMCLAEFCSEYRVLAKSQVPKTPNENVFELLNSKGFIQKRTRTKPAVIRYPRFNVDKMSEKYYQCLLQLFLPHERGSQLKPPGFDLYQTFYENGHVKIANDQNLQAVKLLVDRNHAKFAENEEIIANAQETFETIGEPQDAWASLCPETELIRKECMEERSKLNVLNDNVDEIPDMETEANSADVMFKVQQNNQSREEAMQIIQNLNETQRSIFYYVRDWCLEKSTGQNPDPFHIFITGGAGTGKSHVIKAIHYEASRLLAKNMSTPDSLAVLLTAFTGTAAFNIGGNTIHHLFSLPKYMRLPYEPLKEQTLSELRIQLRDLNVLVIDEVSMVYKRLLYYIHERLVQIKKSKEPFGGVSVIAVGDFYQLPPVKQRKDERLYKDNISYPVDHWQELFKVVELSEIMRQKQDVPFAEVLNSLRTRELQEPLNTETLSMLRECVRQGPEDVLHVYATNDEVNNYNLKMLRKSCNDFVEIDAQDFEKNTATGKLTLRKKPISRSKSDGLSSSLLIAPNARVMLTRNCNVEDGLVNGVMGKILHFLLKDGNVDHVLAVGVIFDNKNVGQRTGRKTPEGNVVLIERVQEEVVEKKSKSFIRHQFPLRLSWACTAHKVQGMTVDKVVVNLDRIFSAGQGYVALTRVKSKDGLFIETNDVNTLDKKVYADAEVKSALFGMNKLKFPNSFERSSLCTRIILHNIQSLKAHFSDLQHDLRFTEADLISLTETWLRPNENLFNFSLDGFSFHSQARGNAYDDQSIDFHTKRFAKGGGVAVYIKGNENDKTVNFLPVNNIEGIAVNLQSIHTVILTLYRPGTTIACKFLQRLQKLLEHYRKDNWNIVCIGDFNEDAHLIGPIQSFMKNQGFRQLVSFNTTKGATILDHVYVSGSLQVGVNKMSTYFSYHDAVVVTIYPNDENA